MDEVQKLTQELSEKNVSLSESARLLSEKEAEMKKLSDQLDAVNAEKREKILSEGVEKLCLSADKTIAFKGGEKDKVLAFVKTLSDDQAKAYFELHEGILTSVDLGEHGEAGEGEGDATDTAAVATADKLAKELCEKTGMSYGVAMNKVLSEHPELAGKIY